MLFAFVDQFLDFLLQVFDGIGNSADAKKMQEFFERGEFCRLLGWILIHGYTHVGSEKRGTVATAPFPAGWRLLQEVERAVWPMP